MTRSDVRRLRVVVDRLVNGTTVERCHRQAFNREQHILSNLEAWALRGDDHIKAIAREKVRQLLPDKSFTFHVEVCNLTRWTAP